MIRAVLFDAVGTVLFPRPSVAEVYHRWGRQFGSRRELPEVRTRFAQVYRQMPPVPVESGEEDERRWWAALVAGVLDDVAEPDRGALFEALWSHFAQPRHWALFDDVAPCWEQLATRGYLCGIASNFDRRLVNLCADLPPLRSAVESERLFYSSQLRASKPAPAFFQRISQRLGLAPEEILLVGDDLQHDFLAARRAGWHALWLYRNPNPAARTAPAGEAPAGEAPAGEAPAGEAPAGTGNASPDASPMAPAAIHSLTAVLDHVDATARMQPEHAADPP